MISQKQKRKLMKQANVNPKPIPKPIAKTYTEKELMEFGESIILSYLASSIITLRDTFGFGKTRIERFLKSESNHAQAIKSGHVTSKDILDQMKLETGFDLNEFVKNQHKEMTTK